MRCTTYLCTDAVIILDLLYVHRRELDLLRMRTVSLLEIIVMRLHDMNIICCDSYAPRKNGSRCSCTGVVSCSLGTVLELAVCGR